MPVPKQKTSKQKTRTRRSQHDKIEAANIVWCDNCGARKLPHRVCLSCGTYRNRQLIRVVVVNE